MSTESVPQAKAAKRVRWHRHRWSQWGEPYKVQLVLFGGMQWRQTRSCSVCNAMMFRTIQ